MTCTDFLQPYVDWLKGGAPNEDRFVALMLVSNDKGGPARYAEGSLRLSNPAIFPISLTGEATLYESHERWGFPPQDPGNGGFSPPIGDFPFDPNKTDKVKVTISFPVPLFALPFQVKITSTTKGQAIINNPQCSGHIMFGFATTGSGDLGIGSIGGIPFLTRPYYVVSLKAMSGTITS